MNLAFLASIAWFIWDPNKKEEPPILAKDKLVNRGIYILQSEADSNVLTANDSDEMTRVIGNVTTDKWKRITKTSWLVKTSDNYTLAGIYRLIPTDNAYNNITLSLPSRSNGRTTNHYWNIAYAGHSFGFDKWLLEDYGSNKTFQGKCLANNGRDKIVVLQPCKKDSSKQRWKFCLCTSPDE